MPGGATPGLIGGAYSEWKAKEGGTPGGGPGGAPPGGASRPGVEERE